MKTRNILFLLCAVLPVVVLSQQTTQITQTRQVTAVSTIHSAAATGTNIPKDNSNPSNDVVPSDSELPAQNPDEAGASGADTGAFSISKGGIAAIIVVVVVVAVGGIGSLVLWYVAKKRQWEVRASIRRASRRLTGRMDTSKSKRQNRRTGVRMASPPAPKDRRRADTDLEKGAASESKGRTTTKISNTFDVETPESKSWKSKLLSSAGKGGGK